MPTSHTGDRTHQSKVVRLRPEVVEDLHRLKIAWRAKTLSDVVQRMVGQNKLEMIKALGIHVQEGEDA